MNGHLIPYFCLSSFSSAVRHFLLFSSELSVRGIPFNLSSQEDVILPITGAPSYFVGVDFSAEDDVIFFSDTAKDMIFKQKVDGTGKHLLCFLLPGSICMIKIAKYKLLVCFCFYADIFKDLLASRRALPCDSLKLMQEVQGVPDGADWYYGGGNGQEYRQWKTDNMFNWH